MDKKYTSLKYTSKVNPLQKINDEFTLCKVYVQGVGKNRNFSYMSKDAIERALPTLSYCPVVGHLHDKYDEDGNKVGSYMGGHDMEITDDWELRSACVPYGVVKEDSFNFEMVEEYADNTQTEYLTAEVILWTGRYPELMDAIYSEDFYFNQSMEIAVEEYKPYEEDSNYTDITDFTYSALCLLGKADDKNSEEHTEPCFVEAKVIPVQFSIENERFEQIFSEMKNQLAFYLNNSDGKEEVPVEDNKNIIEEIDAELAETEQVEETVVDEVEEVSEDVSTDEVESEESPETESEETVEETEEETEDTPVENENESVEENEEPEKSDYELLMEEFEEYKNSHSHTNEEYEILEQYKTETEYAKMRIQKESVLNDERYSVIRENELFKKLIEEMDNYSVEELEKEAKIIFADYIASVGEYSLSEPKTSVKLFSYVAREEKTESRYGNLFN